MHIVYGGSFNPPTKAHLEVYKTLKRKLAIDQFTFLPVGRAYKKESLKYANHRFKMLKLMVKPYDDVKVSDIELNDQSFKGSYVSLKRLQSKDEPLGFIIGADNLRHVHRWKNFHKMIQEFKFIVINRDNQPLQKMIECHPDLAYVKDRFILIEAFNIHASSTEYRQTRNANLLCDDVVKYIEQHNLYRGE